MLEKRDANTFVSVTWSAVINSTAGSPRYTETDMDGDVVAKGKYADWITPEGLLLLEGWARDGLTDEQIAQNMGIACSTFYAWKDRFKEISEALKKGKAPVDIQVENALLKRALGYEYEEVTTEIEEIPYIDKKGNEQVKKHKHVKKTKKYVLPDTTAQIFWLKNRRPDKWRDKPVEVNNDKPDDDGFLAALSGSAAEDWANEEG